MRRAHHHRVDALADLGKLLRQEVGAYATIQRVPGAAVVVAAETTGGRDADVDAFWARRVRNDVVNHHAATTGLPAVARGMLGQSFNFIPVLSAVVAAEQRARVNAAPERVGAGDAVRRHIPDALQVQPAVGRKAQPGAGLAPALAVVGADLQVVAPPGSVDGGPEVAGARVAHQVVDFPAGKERPFDFPALASAVGAEQKGALARADQQVNFLFAPHFSSSGRDDSPETVQLDYSFTESDAVGR